MSEFQETQAVSNLLQHAGVLGIPPSEKLKNADEILQRFRSSQRRDFEMALRASSLQGRSLLDAIPQLEMIARSSGDDLLDQRLDVDNLSKLFGELHDHVMGHPVWTHPFFQRFSTGDFSKQQLSLFGRHYFNQVKNTRQCVALSLGRFHTMLDGSGSGLSSVVSELTQVILAGLLADEYGVSTHTHEISDSASSSNQFDLSHVFSPVTHAGLYRRFLGELGLDPVDQDVPMMHGFADNVLVQRILAGNPNYDHLESLASVGLGMEWGVPAFFSMIIAGLRKYELRNGFEFDPASLEIWTAHVEQDVAHAISVMVATTFYLDQPTAVNRVIEATNVLMAFRYEMMSELYERVYCERCERIDEISLDLGYYLQDRRIEENLISARKDLRVSSVENYGEYTKHRAIPNIFV